MKAIILAAGLGSRLNAITRETPKALVEVNGFTMLETVIRKLKDKGITEFLVNIHHFGQKIINFLDANNNFGVHISISDEREELLNTGGAILKARDFIHGKEDILIHNVDIFSDVNLLKMHNYHTEKNCMATLCIRKRDTKRYLLFDDYNNLNGWTNTATNEFKWVLEKPLQFHPFAFSGIYIINPEFVEKINQKGSFSIIDSWLEVAKHDIVKGFIDKSTIWHDLGTIERITEAEKK